MELMIPLDGRGTVPMYEQIYRFIKEEIRRGHLTAGSRLPSTRILAENLKVSRSTTQMAYDQLLSEGYIESRPYRGYYVAQIEELVEVREIAGGSFVPEQKEETGGIAVDFSPRGIDLDRFPFAVWRKISRNILVNDNKALFSNGDPQGEYALRQAIGSYLHSARGVCCRPDQIIIGAGSEYLLMLLSLILGKDRVIAMEDPTYKQAYRVFCSQGYPVRPIAMDKNGMKASALASGPGRDADTVYVMPSHQYPMGTVMSVRRRQELLSWAYEREGRYLIEDDYDSEFRYRGKPVPALQGMDQNGRVIYIGTFSKSIAPAIRTGFLVLPERLMKRYRERAGFFSGTVNRLDQNILYQFLTEGHYERHLNRMRAVYKSKHDLLLGGLRDFERDFSIGGEYAGLHVLLTDRSGRHTEEELERTAREQGVRVYGLSGYFICPEAYPSSPTVLLGYASLSGGEIERGLSSLRKAWRIG